MSLSRTVVHHPIADLQLALADVLQPGDHPQQGGLAAPRRADEHHELAVAYLQVDNGDRPGATGQTLPTESKVIPAMAFLQSVSPRSELPHLERVCRHGSQMSQADRRQAECDVICGRAQEEDEREAHRGNHRRHRRPGDQLAKDLPEATPVSPLPI